MEGSFDSYTNFLIWEDESVESTSDYNPSYCYDGSVGPDEFDELDHSINYFRTLYENEERAAWYRQIKKNNRRNKRKRRFQR